MTHEELWQTLEQEARNIHAAGIHRRRITPPENRALYLGFKKPDDRRVFLLRVAKTHLPQASALPAMRGVEVWAAALPPDLPAHASLGLTLREARYADVFTALVNDLASHVGAQSNDAEAVAAFLSRVGKWQKFLENHVEGLGEEAQRGLFGELRFLRDHVLPRLGSSGVPGWTGSRRTPQDFQFPSCVVEVKTSIAKQLQVLRIANERQLDDAHVQALFLYHLSLEPLRGMGETLPQLVESVRSGLGVSIEREHFEDTLLEAGYLDAHAPRYSAVGYSDREVNVFRVREGFPRLTERDLPPGVGDVSYAISVDQCQPFRASISELDVAFTRPNP